MVSGGPTGVAGGWTGLGECGSRYCQMSIIVFTEATWPMGIAKCHSIVSNIVVLSCFIIFLVVYVILYYVQ